MSPEEYRAYREKLGLTQAELAREVGRSRETINKREAGGQIIDREAALAIRALRAPARRRTHTPSHRRQSRPSTKNETHV